MTLSVSPGLAILALFVVGRKFTIFFIRLPVTM